MKKHQELILDLENAYFKKRDDHEKKGNSAEESHFDLLERGKILAGKAP